ncbi:MAG: YfhO family protein [Anaerolineae bacterium]|nr:YfhO family protein [Anaerolineae bacterium]MDW8069891.1 YfhO family protein [Anaerolineae bacterium]
MPGHVRGWAVGSALVIGICALFLPACLQPDAWLYPTYSPHSDLTVIHWPKVHLMTTHWRATGELPLWTPANLSGMPLAANQLAMRFYPPAWLLLLMPSGTGFNLFLALHLGWAGLGTWWLLRRVFRVDALPALLGGWTFALSGKLIAHMAGGHASLIAAAAWMPWAFGATSQLFDATSVRARLGWAVWAGLALAAQLATHMLIVLYTSYLLAAWALWQMFCSGRVEARRLGALVSALGVIPLSAFALGAAPLLPLIELWGYSNRALSLEEAGAYALTPLQLGVALFLPQSHAGHEAVAYLGLVPLVLAGWGLRRDDRRTWFLAGVVLIALLYALGRATPCFELVYRFAPGMASVRTPARALIVGALALAVLAALGGQRLVQGRIPWHSRVIPALAAVTTMSGGGLAALGRADRATLGLACLPLATVLTLGLAARGRWHASLAGLVLACLTWGDLVSFGYTLLRFIPAQEAFAPGAAAAEYLSRQPGLWRSYSPSYSLPPHVAARAGIQTADGVEPVHLERYDRFMELAGNYAHLPDVPAGHFSVTIPPFPPGRPLERAFRDVPPNLALLGLLNVTYVVSAFALPMDDLALLTQLEHVYIYRNHRALPRAWVLPTEVARPFLYPDIPTDWQPQLEALSRSAATWHSAMPHAVVIQEYQPDRIVLAARVERASVLVLSENWYPGWRAWVDDVPAEVRPVAGLLRGVPLEAGEHRVVLAYQPLSARIGIGISTMAGVGLLLFIALIGAPRLVSRPVLVGGKTPR